MVALILGDCVSCLASSPCFIPSHQHRSGDDGEMTLAITGDHALLMLTTITMNPSDKRTVGGKYNTPLLCKNEDKYGL